jgi:hypothetical protein
MTNILPVSTNHHAAARLKADADNLGRTDGGDQEETIAPSLRGGFGFISSLLRPS